MAVVVVVVVAVKFFPVKRLLSLEYLTTGEDEALLVVLLLEVKLSLREVGNPAILLFLFT